MSLKPSQLKSKYDPHVLAAVPPSKTAQWEPWSCLAAMKHMICLPDYLSARGQLEMTFQICLKKINTGKSKLI